MAVREDACLNMYINGKKIWFTEHINQEMDEERKDRFFVAEIVDKGMKRLVSKKDGKYESSLPIGEFVWLVSFVEGNKAMILIHLGKKKR